MGASNEGDYFRMREQTERAAAAGAGGARGVIAMWMR